MSPLNIIVASPDANRLYAGLELAIAAAALGRRVRIFFQGTAVALLKAPIGCDGDAARLAAGQPDLAWMVNEAGAMGIALLACQSGLAVTALATADLDAIVQPTGLIAFLSGVDPGEQLLTL